MNGSLLALGLLGLLAFFAIAPGALASTFTPDRMSAPAPLDDGSWQLPAAAAPYADAIARAEQANRLPPKLLARVLYEESRYRPEVIDGRVTSVTGAIGIAQFMPDTAAELGIDPANPVQAIPAAARYIAGLYNQFSDWTLALAAYNWGMGNVRRSGMSRVPTESIDYATNILHDVQVFG